MPAREETEITEEDSLTDDRESLRSLCSLFSPVWLLARDATHESCLELNLALGDGVLLASNVLALLPAVKKQGKKATARSREQVQTICLGNSWLRSGSRNISSPR